MMKLTLTLITLATTYLCIGQAAGSVVCPANVSGEVGTDIDIACNILGDIDLVYWYRGVSTEKSLAILSLEDGQFGGTEYEGGTFGMREDGTMVISNLQLGHGGIYVILVFFYDGSSSASQSVVSAYIRPHRSCPTIDSCGPTCEPCDLKRTSEGVLGCSISGARPKLEITWKIVAQNHVNFVERPPVHTEEGGIVNSSVSIVYRPAKCGARAVLRCVARNSFYELEDTTVTIQSESCGQDPGIRSQPPDVTPCPAYGKDEEETSAAPSMIVPILCIGYLPILIGACYLGYRRYRRNITSCFTRADDIRDILVRRLVGKYMREVCVEPEEGPDIPDPNKNCVCTYYEPDGTLSVCTINDLYTKKFLDTGDRMLIIASREYGKQTTTKKLLVDWSLSKHEYLLLYFPMGELTRGRNLFEMVKERYASNIRGLTVEDIKDVCKRNRYHILLGNLEDRNPGNLGSGESEEELLERPLTCLV